MGTETTSVEISEPLLLDDSDKIKAVETVDDDRVPEWRDQITIRGLVVSAVLGTLFCIITHKLNLTVGIIPSLNVAAGLLGFFFVKSWTGFLAQLGFEVKPFTRQENTVIQTCVVACYGLAFSGGFGSYLVAMDEKTYKLIGEDYPGNRAEDVINPGLWWMTGFLVVVSFLGLFSLVPLRKVMVMDYKLTYPSGTATAMLINSFHTKSGAELAGKQVHCLGKYLSMSLIWSCFKWFFSGIGDSCGFDNFPSLGLALFKNTFYFDFSPTYVGCGLICPHIVNCSVLFGAIISWGFLWPLISQHAGHWYPADLGSNDFKGLYGYKVFIAIALILGDGLYNLIKIIAITLKEICNKSSKQSNLPLVKEKLDGESSEVILEQKKRDEVFLKDRIPNWVAGSGYVALVAISTATMPIIFPPLKWYLVLCSYILAPALAFCNSYGTGLTDWNLTSTYGKGTLSANRNLLPMAALTRLAKPSFASRSPISYLSRCLYSGVASEPSSHAASSYNPHLGPKPSRLVNDSKNRSVQWVFLGSPGVGKGTYASRLSNLLGVPHIATGDLVREELVASGPLSQQLSEIVNQGKLVSDEIIINLLSKRLEAGEAKGELGFILDGFPRTIRQAEILEGVTDIDLVLNLKLREDVLLEKCLGRRTCGQCGGNFNVASINVKGSNGCPAISMAPLLPPQHCMSKLVTRADDTEEVIKHRIDIYNEKSRPVEEFYRRRGKLLEFDLPGGIPESWPKLLEVLDLDDYKEQQSAAA